MIKLINCHATLNQRSASLQVFLCLIARSIQTPILSLFSKMLKLLLAIFTLSSILTYAAEKTEYRLETLAEGLNFPWSIAFLPEGGYLVSLRSGQLVELDATGSITKTFENIPDTYFAGQGGYMDIMLDSNFSANKLIFLAYAHGDRQSNATQVIRAKLEGSRLDDTQVIFKVKDRKSASAHYGGRLIQLKDDTIVLTTGDGFNLREKSQDKFSHLGKVLRFTRDGKPPQDNPFADGKGGDPYVFAYGQRNPQGLVYDEDKDQIYLHEHGPKGGDEFNLIVAGKNYGWPATSYGVNYSGAKVSPYSSLPGIEEPLKYWTPSIAPSGLTLYKGNLFPKWKNSFFLGTLVNRDVRRLTLKDNLVKEEVLFSELGERIRDIQEGRDGFLYILTDGSGGKLIRVAPKP